MGKQMQPPQETVPAAAYLWLGFRWFQLPAVSCGPHALNGKFQIGAVGCSKLPVVLSGVMKPAWALPGLE